MSNNKQLSPLVIGLIAATSSTAWAADPMPLETTAFTTFQRNFQLMGPAVNQAAPRSANTMQIIQQRTDDNKITHVRMQQHYIGFPVFRGYAIVHSTQSNTALLGAKNAVKMNGVVYNNLDAELGQPSPAFVKNSSTALQRFKTQYQNESVSEENVTPMVYIDDDNRAFWAYKVSVLVQPQDRIPERPTAIVDAQTYEPFVQWNDVKTIRTKVNGDGYGGNSSAAKIRFGLRIPYLEISRNEATGICYMENEGTRVVNMAHRYQKANRAMQFGCKVDSSSGIYWTGYKADGYDQDNGAYSPTNDALYAGYVINHLYSEWYHVPALVKNDKPMQLVMRVHYGKGYENAFWDGSQMTFGDGDRLMHPLVSLGVGAHEISHGFTEQHSGLEYFGQSGGMNEAFSDMASQAAEYYSKRRSSWQIGADIMKKNSGFEALRYMDKPSRDGRSIDNANEYYPGLDVHYSSGVYNRLFYILAHKFDWNTRKAFDVMVKANMDYWTPYSTFEQGGCGLISSARDLGLSVTTVKDALNEVAISYEHCNDMDVDELASS